MSNKQNTNTQKAKGKNSPKATGNASSPKSSKSKKNKRLNHRMDKNSVPLSRANVMVSYGSPKSLMRTGPKSELLFTIPPSDSYAFQVMKRIRINPLSRETFKWLPSIAQNFESFKFHRLRVRYENRCAATSSGSILLSPSYDSADSDAQAATEALIYENKGTLDFSVWKAGVMSLLPAAMNRLYKSHTCMSDERFALTAQDKKTIDPAQVFICLDGCDGLSSPGKIFLDYDVEFFEPHAPTEPINLGGAAFRVVTAGTTMTPSSTTPLTIQTSVDNIIQEKVPILKLLNQLREEGLAGNVTGTFGQFTKDWSGILDLTTTGTGLNNLGSAAVYKGIDGLTATASAGDQLLPQLLNTVITTNSGLVNNRSTYKVEANAGDYLKLATTAATTITSIVGQLAATSAISLF